METNIHAYMNSKDLHELCNRHNADPLGNDLVFLKDFASRFLGQNAKFENREITGHNDHLVEMFLRDPEENFIWRIQADNLKADKGKRSKVFSDVFYVKVNFGADPENQESALKSMGKFLDDFSNIMSARTIGRAPEGDEQKGEQWNRFIDQQRMKGEVPLQYANIGWDIKLPIMLNSENMDGEIRLAAKANSMFGSTLNDINASIEVKSNQEENSTPKP